MLQNYQTTSLNPVAFFCSQLFCSNFTNMLQNFSALGQPFSCRLKGDCMPLSKTFLCVKSLLSLLCVINCDSEKVNSLLFNKHNFVPKTMRHLFTFNQPIWEQLWDPRKYERQFRARVINTTSSTPFRDFFFFILLVVQDKLAFISSNKVHVGNLSSVLCLSANILRKIEGDFYLVLPFKSETLFNWFLRLGLLNSLDSVCKAGSKGTEVQQNKSLIICTKKQLLKVWGTKWHQSACWEFSLLFLPWDTDLG